MRHLVRSVSVLSIGTWVALALVAGPAAAHQHRHVGGIETTVGWEDEPAYAGFRNGISFRAARPVAGSEEGTPVTGATLEVEVTFGGPTGTGKMGPLDLEPAFGDPGHYRTAIIPTRPGTYTFHITGRLAGRAFDQTYTSGDAGKNAQSEGTYDDINDPAEIKFPVKDPTAGELADRTQRIDARLQSAQRSLQDDADSAGTKALVGIIVGGVALLVGLAGFAAGRRSKGAA